MSFEIDLQDILEDDDFDIYDREWLYDALEDLRDEDTLHANLIMIAYDAGVFEDIYDESDIDTSFYDEQVSKLVNDFGLTDESANWVVYTCCKVYGENVLLLDCDIEKKTQSTKRSALKKKTESKPSGDYISFSELSEAQKIPKDMVQRVLEAEDDLGIDDMTLNVTYDGSFCSEDKIKIVGELISSNLTADVVLFIMIYNGMNEMIGASFGTKIRKDDCNGVASFSTTVYFPVGETLSKVIVRPVQNPAGFW